jgi:DNA mismatch repair ATPase MutL
LQPPPPAAARLDFATRESSGPGPQSLEADPLTTAEIEALLARRDLVARSSNCHGRPTTLRLTLRDLEKQFKRTGF